jgi:hypothetical protein
MDAAINPDRANDLRYALASLEEHSYLGLDNKYASILRGIVQRRI